MINAAAANFVEERADKRFAATADIFEESFRLLHEVDYAAGIPTGMELTDWQNCKASMILGYYPVCGQVRADGEVLRYHWR
jgi:hypothetical protein